MVCQGSSNISLLFLWDCLYQTFYVQNCPNLKKNVNIVNIKIFLCFLGIRDWRWHQVDEFKMLLDVEWQDLRGIWEWQWQVRTNINQEY